MLDYRKVISFLLHILLVWFLSLTGFNIVLENSWRYVMYDFSNKSCVSSRTFGICSVGGLSQEKCQLKKQNGQIFNLTYLE